MLIGNNSDKNIYNNDSMIHPNICQNPISITVLPKIAVLDAIIVKTTLTTNEIITHISDENKLTYEHCFHLSPQI